MPVYNEEENIVDAITTAYTVAAATAKEFELIVIDDGSTDTSVKLIKKMQKKFVHLRLVQHQSNKGYGNALRTGILESKYNYTFYTDADNQFDISLLPKLFKEIKKNEMIIGFRVQRKDSWQRLIMTKVYRFIIGLLFNVWVTDANCSFKLFPTKLFNESTLQSNTVFIDAEMIIRAKKENYLLREVAVKHFKREKGSSKFELGKKGVMLVIHPGKVLGVIKEIIKIFPSLRFGRHT